jgi:23S rRNA (adenine2503-C2)-methyltransferase
MTDKPFIYDLEHLELVNLLTELGEPSYRADQIWQGLYKQYWNTPDEFTNLPQTLREQLGQSVRFEALKPIKYLDSSDGQTRKTLFQLPDNRLIEAVLMKYDPSTHRGQGRRTLCISSQAGCAMGCVFCATGQMGFQRHLTSGEIVAQVMHYARMLQAQEENVTNIVLMGMGEPFHNYDNTMAAIDRLNDPNGYAFGARRFTISTVGLVTKIRQFADEKRQVNLAISLHAADDEERGTIMPVNKRNNISKLLEACRYYVDQTGRRISFEWALISGVNDTEEVARKLASRLKGLMCHVNAIPLNPTTGYQGRATTRQSASKFKATLEQAGIPCTIRMRRGIDIQAGCGQLAGFVVSFGET